MGASVRLRLSKPVGNIDLARVRSLRSVVSYNSRKLPVSDVCAARMDQVASFSRNPENIPKFIVSEGRGGGSLAMFIAEWTSNDVGKSNLLSTVIEMSTEADTLPVCTIR